MDLALYEPDIPQNTAAILRTAACLGLTTHIVGPAGFDLSQRATRRAGLDYAAGAALLRHENWRAFRASQPGRVVLLTTRGEARLDRFQFERNDTLLFGSESKGVPGEVHAACDHRVRIAMVPDQRSLNLAVAVGIGLCAALKSSGLLDTERYE